MYSLLIDLNANPPKISLKSTDSIEMAKHSEEYAFVDVLRFEQHKMGFFYQKPTPNLSGEVQY
jgi:hypothetical protein